MVEKDMRGMKYEKLGWVHIRDGYRTRGAAVDFNDAVVGRQRARRSPSPGRGGQGPYLDEGAGRDGGGGTKREPSHCGSLRRDREWSSRACGRGMVMHAMRG